MITSISLAEFQAEAPELYERLMESDGPLYIEEDGRAVMEIRKFQHGPAISRRPQHGVLLNEGDIIFPIEPDGYKLTK